MPTHLGYHMKRDAMIYVNTYRILHKERCHNICQYMETTNILRITEKTISVWCFYILFLPFISSFCLYLLFQLLFLPLVSISYFRFLFLPLVFTCYFKFLFLPHVSISYFNFLFLPPCFYLLFLSLISTFCF